MKIKLSKSQWEGIGKKAGWMKHVAQAPSTYADWEGKSAVYIGAQAGNPQTPAQSPQAGKPATPAPSQQKQQKQYTSQQIVEWSRKTPPNYQKAIARLMQSSDPEQIKMLNSAVAGDRSAQAWLKEYVDGMGMM